MIKLPEMKKISIPHDNKEKFAKIYADLLLSLNEKDFLQSFYEAYVIFNNYQMEFLYHFISDVFPDEEDKFRDLAKSLCQMVRVQEDIMIEQIIANAAND
jgi:hypothetical protein